MPGSPFTCESYDPKKVSIRGIPRAPSIVHNSICFMCKYTKNKYVKIWLKQNANTNYDNYCVFTVNAEDAGKAEIELLAISPSGQNVPVQAIQQADGQIIIEFIPNSPGHYKLHILYGGEQINGSPLTFAVMGLNASQSDLQQISNGNGLEIAHRGKETSFTVYCPATPIVQIDRFEEQSERIEPKIKSLGNNEWKVSYTILSVGKYDIRATCPNRGPLPGSPWIISCVDPNKVIPIGGWGALLDEDGRLILPARIVFDTTQAGPGELLCNVDGKVLGKNLMLV